LLGRAKKAGDFVELAIPAPDAQPRKLVLRTTQAPDYATLRFNVNGTAVAAPFDGYAPKVQPGPAVELGTFTPRDGRFVLLVEATGMNPAAGKGDMLFGLDRVEVRN
jgi:hypothetical protein